MSVSKKILVLSLLLTTFASTASFGGENKGTACPGQSSAQAKVVQEAPAPQPSAAPEGAKGAKGN